MDIASVYLNFATLLGTEIEVEGYYGFVQRPTMQVFLYAFQYERNSEKVFLPLDVFTKRLIRASDWPAGPAKVFIKGTLSQNMQGDPFLAGITSIAYKTQDVFFRAELTHNEQQLVCRQYTDLILDWNAYFQDLHTPIKDMTLVSSILSKPVLLEGYLWPYVQAKPREWSLMLVVDNIVYSLDELWRIKISPSLAEVYHAILGVEPFWKDPNEVRQPPRFMNLGAYPKIWIPVGSQADSYLERYFHERKYGNVRTMMDAKFAIAGTIAYLDENIRASKGFSPRMKLTFTRIDYIAAQQTITFKPTQEGAN